MRGESHGPGGVLARRWHGAGGATLRRERRPRFPHHAAPHLPLLPLPRGGLDPAVSRAAADPSCAAATAHARESLSKSGTTGVGSRAVGGAVRGCGAAHPRGDPTARPTRGTQTGAAHVVLRLGDRRASADPRAAQAGTEGQARTATSRSRQPRRPSAFVCRLSRPTPHRFGARRPQGLVPPGCRPPPSSPSPLAVAHLVGVISLGRSRNWRALPRSVGSRAPRG